MSAAAGRTRSGRGDLPPTLRRGLWLALAFLASIAVAALWPVRQPSWLLDYFTPGQLARAAALGRARDLGFAAAQALQVLALAWLARRALRRSAGGGLREVFAWAAAAVFVVRLAALPFDYVLGFRVAHAYGLSTATLGQWLGDWLKSAAVDLVASLLAVAPAYLVMRRSPRRWWIAAGAALAALIGASTLLGPVLVDPLFFRFAPLAPGPLRAGIEALAARAHVHLTQIYVMNASSRTTALNAYVTGLGGTARVVLYDTLLARATPGQVLLVVAHELGHWKRHDELAGTLLGMAGAFLAAGLLGWLLPRLRRAGLLDAVHDPRGVPALLLALALLSILALPVRQAISRGIEARADAFALALTRDPQGYARLQAHLAAAGVVWPDPPAWIEWTLHGHPSPAQRIEAALSARWAAAGRRRATYPPPRQP